MDLPTSLTDLHRYAFGWTVVGAWGVVCLWSLGLLIARREEAPTFWRFVSLAQILIVVQVVFGTVLLLMGRRPGPGGAFTNVFHVLYGFGFPLLVLFFGHRSARQGRWNPFAIFSVVGLVLFALLLRGYQVGIHGA